MKQFKSDIDRHFEEEKKAKINLEMGKKSILNEKTGIDNWIAKQLRMYKRFKEGYDKYIRDFDNSVNEPYLSKLLSNPKVGVEIAQKIKDLDAYQAMYDPLKSHSYEIDNLYNKIMKVIPDAEKELRETSELQKTLSLCKMVLKLKNTTKPRGWKPPHMGTHQILQQMYHEHIRKIDHMKQMLPKLVAKELSESQERREGKNDVIREIRAKLNYGKIRVESLMPYLYREIDSIYNDLAKVFPEHLGSSDSKREA